jgi:Domain of unknown function (DUF4157)
MGEPRIAAGTAPAHETAVAHRAVQSGVLRRQCACGTHTPGGGECRDCERTRLQRKASGREVDVEAPPIVHDVLGRAGQPLDAPVRALLEPRFGRDFSGVRVHTDARAAASARAVGALAYTVGEQIAFDTGRYDPRSQAGQRLIAHELAHTVQQHGVGAVVAPRLEVGSADSPAEVEADRVADRVLAGWPAPALQASPTPLVQRQPRGTTGDAEPNFDSPQQHGGRARATSFDAGRRGNAGVRMHVIRYLCECVGRNVTKTSASTHIRPGPGVTLEICNGRVTGRLTGDVVPSSFSTGRATVRAEINVAPGSGGTGVRGGVEGEVRNTGTEPQVGGRIDVRVRPPGGPEVGASGEVFRGTQTGRVDTAVGVGTQVNVPGIGPVTITGQVTNPQDARRGGQILVGTNLPGQRIDNKVCRECRCPVVYECFEDVQPDPTQETFDVPTLSRLRYYFKLDTNEDTGDRLLKAQSDDMIKEVERRVRAGARIVSIVGYASPEDNRERPVPNAQLAVSRGQRLRDRLVEALGPRADLPEPTGGGELFGSVPTIAPGSKLADAILDTGFGDPEDVSNFLVGPDIANPQLSQQFLALLERVPEPADRLRLFGVDPASPAKARLLAAIDQFVRSRGRGSRPWEGMFGFLRYATVELRTTRQETRQVDQPVIGPTRINDTQCMPHARHAESEGRFGPAAPEPRTEAECPGGEAHNPGYEQKCDYT